MQTLVQGLLNILWPVGEIHNIFKGSFLNIKKATKSMHIDSVHVQIKCRKLIFLLYCSKFVKMKVGILYYEKYY